MEAKKSKLKGGEELGKLFQQIADSYQNGEAYCILAMYAEYDVPVKGHDAMGDSDTIFPHLLLSLCPVTISKEALSYRKKENRIGDTAKNLILSPPTFGILFPAFHDRASDIHAMLVYTKKQTEAEDYVISNVFSCIPPVSAERAKDGFSFLLSESLGENCTFGNVAAVQEGLQEKEEVGKEELYSILSSCGDMEKDAYDSMYEKNFRNSSIPASQIAPSKATVKAGSITVTCPADFLELVEVREVDGKRCIVISPDGNVEINGLPVL